MMKICKEEYIYIYIDTWNEEETSVCVCFLFAAVPFPQDVCSK